MIAITILCSVCLFTLVNDSEAIEITSLYPSYGGYYDYSGYLYHTACVRTDEPFSDVWWYINDVHVGSSSSDLNNPQTTAYFSTGSSDYPGSPLGKSYEIKAVVQSFIDENGNIDQDTDSYTAYVYTTPVTGSATGALTMASMNGEVDAGWNGTTAEAKAYGSITNHTNDDIVYGIRVHYLVARLQGNGAIQQALDWPDPLAVKHGTIDANAVNNDEDYSYTDSFTLWNGGIIGKTYIVEVEVTISAQIVGDDPNRIDTLSISDSQTLSIPNDD